MVVQQLAEVNERCIGVAPIIVGQLRSGTIADSLQMLPGGLAGAHQVQMVAEKPHNNEHHAPNNHSTDDNGYGGIDTRPGHGQHEHEHAGQYEHDGDHNSRQERQEIPVVSFTDAVVHKRAVMVEHLHAVLAGCAVAGSLRTVDLARAAVPAVVHAVLVQHPRHQVLLVFLVLQGQEGAAWDDAGVRETGQEEEHEGEHPREGYRDGQDGADLRPQFGGDEDVVGDHHHQQAAVVVGIGGPVAERAGDVLAAAESVIARPEFIKVFNHTPDYNKTPIIITEWSPMWKQFIRKLKKKEPTPVIRAPQQKKVLYFGDVTPILLNQQNAASQIVNTISSINIIMQHIKDSQQDLYKLFKLYQIICQEQINMSELSHSFYNSISYQYYPIRSLIWKILIGYLPDRKNKWITFMESNKKGYERMLMDNLAATIRKRPNTEDKKIDKEPTVDKVKIGSTECKDHPLNRKSDSQWNTYFKDIQLWNKIEKDVLRTRKSVNFFQVQHQYEFQHQQFPSPLNLSKNRSSFHYDAISRILFLYAKLHPKQGYCQGMNQIAALLYYSFTNLNTEYERRVSQSDAYFCFQIVMKQIGYSNFASNEMLSARVQVFCQCIKKIDPKLYDVLSQAKIDIKLFAMRWFMVYMLQEFEINNSLLIWDGLLSAEIGVSKYLYYICLAVLFIKREALMQSPTTIYEIQKLDLKPEAILETANNLYREYPNLQLV